MKRLHDLQALLFFLAVIFCLGACEKNKKEAATPDDLDEKKLGVEAEAFESPVGEGYDLGESDQSSTIDEPAPALGDVGSKAKKVGDKYAKEGIALLGGGNMSGASAKFKEALEEDPKACVAAYNLGVLAETKGKYAKAKKYYKQSFTAKPSYGPAVAAYVMLEYKTTGSKKSALNFIKPRAQKHKDSYEIQTAYAKLLVEDNQLGKAMDVAKTVLKKDERNVGAMIALAKAYHKNGQDEFARFIVNQAMDIDENNAEIYVILSYIAISDGDKKAAMGHLKKAVDLNPRLIEARNNLAVLYLDGASFEDAAGHLEAIVPYASYKAEVFLNLGEAYRGMRKWKKSIDSFKQAEKLGAPKQMIYFNLALLYFSADSVPGMSKKQAYKKSQSYFLQYRDAVGAKAAMEEIDIDTYLKRLDKMIKIQEKLEAKKKGGG